MAGVAKPLGQARVPGGYKENTDKIGTTYSPGVYVGQVKKNDDIQNMGRLKVYIKDFGGDPRDESSWVSVSYASPFAGSTSIHEQGQNVQEYEDTIKSYGWWAVPPDLDSFVLVAFASGKISEGYWFACLYQRGTTVTVPGIPALNTWGGDNKPAAPKNRKDLDPDLQKYVEHKPMSEALKKQGLLKDPIRGLTSSGATRESPSRVIGLLTPGQHQFVLDDGDKDGNNRLIRLRTTNGTQLLLDDVAGHIYLITKNGENWVELSGDGNIHVYSSKDINIRAEGNLNLRADTDINIEAGSSVNIKSLEGSINLDSANEVNTLAATNTKITSVQTSNINSGTGHYETAGVIHMNGPIADAADPISTYTLSINQGVSTSICNTLPEHEPWGGHSGTVNPMGHGNQQMKEDPAPDQVPRKPDSGEQGAAISGTTSKQPEVSVDSATASEAVQDVIKAKNGFSPVNVSDSGGESGGFATAIIPNKTSSTTSAISAVTNSTPITPSSTTNSTAFNLPLPSGTGDTSLGASIIQQFNKAVSASNAAGSLIDKAAAMLQPGKNALKAMSSAVASVFSGGIKNTNPISNDVVNTLSSGISASKAASLFAQDIANNEKDVKRVLSNAGIGKIPQNVFDGLVSFQNQVGDITYAYVNGQKVDLTGMYAAGEWDRVASFIAADERDRPRRIVEATIISANDYGPQVNLDHIVNKGTDDAAEAIAKNRLNEQTGDPATAQQVVAAATSYWNKTGKQLPNQNFGLTSLITDSDLSDSVKRKPIGPWPY